MSASALTLYESVATLDIVVSTLATIEAEGTDTVLSAALEAELRETLTATRDKVDRTASVLAAMESAEACVDREIERLTARKARIVAERERLEGYVISVLMAAGAPKFEGHISTLAIRKNPVSVLIEGEIPADYMRTPVIKMPTPAPDKALIKAALTNGIDVPGARLTQTLKLVRS